MRWFRRKQRRQRGTAAVEFAFVAPVFFAIVFCMIEFGRAGMIIHMLEGAARDGCRTAILEGATEAQVKARVTAVLADGGITKHRTTVTPTNFIVTAQWEPITVYVEVNHDDVSWLPLPKYFSNRVLSGSCTLPKESG